MLSLQANVGPNGLDFDWAKARAHPGAVVVLIHGFKFSPFEKAHNPHTHILAPAPSTTCWKGLSWQSALGVASDPNVLPVAFGWDARGSIWRAHRQSENAGLALAALIGGLQKQHPGRKISLIGHSLGARVILRALREVRACDVRRAILLGAAAFQSEAQAAIAAPAGRTCEVLNVTSRENDLFEVMFEMLIGAPAPQDRSLGRGLGKSRVRWSDLEIDSPGALSSLARLGYPVAAPKRRICHWSTYLRPGVFDLYRDFLKGPEVLSLSLLQSALPERSQPRWSRLLAWRPTQGLTEQP